MTRACHFLRVLCDPSTGVVPWCLSLGLISDHLRQFLAMAFVHDFDGPGAELEVGREQVMSHRAASDYKFCDQTKIVIQRRNFASCPLFVGLVLIKQFQIRSVSSAQLQKWCRLLARWYSRWFQRGLSISLW